MPQSPIMRCCINAEKKEKSEDAHARLDISSLFAANLNLSSLNIGHMASANDLVCVAKEGIDQEQSVDCAINLWYNVA